MSLNLSPTSSENGGTPINARPEINLNLIKSTRKKGFVPPKGIFSNKENRSTLESRYWGNAPFFTNAKPAAMLERGWMRSLSLLKGQRGLLTIKDGPEVEVKVLEGLHYNLLTGKKFFTVIELGSSTREPIDLPVDSWHEEWDFYIPTKPIPFIPRHKSLAQEWIKSDYLRMKKGVKGLIKVKDGPEMEVEVMKEFHRIEVMDASGNLIKDTVCSVKDIHTGELLNFSMGKNFTGEWDFYIRPSLARGGSKKRKVQRAKKTRSKLRRKA